MKNIFNLLIIIMTLLLYFSCTQPQPNKPNDNPPDNNNAGDTINGGSVTPLSNGRLFYTFDSYLSTNIDYIVSADFNNDGLDDIAGIDYTGNSVKILINMDNYTFIKSYIIIGNTGDHPNKILSDDLNNDGNKDIVILKIKTNSAFILLGKGDGTFQSNGDLSLSNRPYSIALGDANNDSIVDIIAGVYSTNGHYYLNISAGNGDGTFNSPSLTELNTEAFSIAIGNFNNDGYNDIIITEDDNIRILLGQSNNSFIFGNIYSTGISPGGITVYDFNSDNVNDVVLINKESNFLSVFLGNGDGTLQNRTDYSTDNEKPIDIVVGDFNNDSIIDIVYLGDYRALNLLSGIGDGTFIPGFLRFGTGGYPLGIAVGYFNSDQILDIVTSDVESDYISLIYGQGNDFFCAPISLFASGNEPSYIACKDLDSDGNTDIVITNKDSGSIDVFLGNGDGAFTGPDTYTTGITMSKPIDICITDINNDTIPDLVVVNSESYHLTFYNGNGDGTFGNMTNYTVYTYCYGIKEGDYNKDGNIDLCLISSSNAFLLIGDGSGGFTKTSSFGSFTYSQSIESGYFDNDNNLDLIIGTRINLYLLKGNGDDTFQNQEKMFSLPSGSDGIRDIVTGLYNNDNILDVVFPVNNDASDFFKAQIILCNDDGSVKTKMDFDVLEDPRYITTGYYTDDNVLDISVSSFDDQSISILENDGNGIFGEADVYKVCGPARKMCTADFNNDGREDIALVDGSNIIQVLLHQ